MRRLMGMLMAVTLVMAACKKKDLSSANYTSQTSGNSADAVASLQNLNTSGSPLGVIELPASVDSKIRGTFKWYAKVMAPNGKPIHLLASSAWTAEKVGYTRSVLEHYLTNVSGILYGNKDEVANSIANSNGAMTMFDNANAVTSNGSGITGQDLQADETVAVGSQEYIDLSVRNAALEEILHFVHDLGLSKVYPNWQKELETATTSSVSNLVFTPWSNLPVADYDNELLASHNDAYWGTTEHSALPNLPYLFLSREAAAAGDPLTTSVQQKIQPTYFASTVQVVSSFSGTFYLYKRGDTRYTAQSQYYRNVQLMGSNPNHLEGNDMDNTLMGNTGNNQLTGGKGNDQLNGGDGQDIARYSGSYAEYTVSTSGGTTTITDNVSGRDGIDQLNGIEQAQFADQTVNL